MLWPLRGVKALATSDRNLSVHSSRSHIWSPKASAIIPPVLHRSQNVVCIGSHGCLPSSNDQIKEVAQRNPKRFLDSLHDAKLNNASYASTKSTILSITSTGLCGDWLTYPSKVKTRRPENGGGTGMMVASNSPMCSGHLDIKI